MIDLFITGLDGWIWIGYVSFGEWEEPEPADVVDSPTTQLDPRLP